MAALASKAVTSSADLDGLIAEQTAYYRAAAGEFGDLKLPFPGGDELEQALERFRPRGDVLELACGPGTWTNRLLGHASTVTAVDSSPEMLSLAREKAGEDRVRFVMADLFSWLPDRRYDVVFFGFFLSHVPRERFESFWSMIGESLSPSGRVFFVDDGYRTAEELVEGEGSEVIQRTLRDGAAHRLVKVPYEPSELERRLAALGWSVRVSQTQGPFYWGEGVPTS